MSPSGSKAASFAFNGSKPLAISHQSGMPSPSLSPFIGAAFVENTASPSNRPACVQFRNQSLDASKSCAVTPPSSNRNDGLRAVRFGVEGLDRRDVVGLKVDHLAMVERIHDRRRVIGMPDSEHMTQLVQSHEVHVDIRLEMPVLVLVEGQVARDGFRVDIVRISRIGKDSSGAINRCTRICPTKNPVRMRRATR